MARLRAVLLLSAIGLDLLSCSPSASAAEACFGASKTYRIHPLRGGADRKDGWSIQGEAFAQCVHRAEAADKSLRDRYPDTLYALSLTATIGCHSPC